MSTLLLSLWLLGADPQAPITPGGAPNPPAANQAAVPPANASAPAAASAPANPETTRDLWLRLHDRDGDGRVSLQECPPKLLRAFARADLNHDGFLDSQEILLGRTRISNEARRMEKAFARQANGQANGQAGNGEQGRAGEVMLAIGAQLLRRMDLNNDGLVTNDEFGAALRDPAGLLASAVPPIPVPGGPAGAAATPLPTDPNAAVPANQVAKPVPDGGTPAAPQASIRGIGPDGLPTVDAIMKNLDHNGDGFLDRSECVDRLADNFNFLDQDRNGKLDRNEVERGLRLAKMFGMKPISNIEQYRKPKTATAPLQTPPAAGQPEARKSGNL